MLNESIRIILVPRQVTCLIGMCFLTLNAAAITFEKVPPVDTVSVIINAPDGHLVRTLMANEPPVRNASGTLEADWDGTDDWGHAVPPGPYRATLVGNAIKYAWEGTLGNSSRDAGTGGEHIFRSFAPIRHLAVDPIGNAFFVTGYNELGVHFHRFTMRDPQVPSDFLFDDFNRSFESVDTDGVLVYYANIGAPSTLACSSAGNDGTATFVVATRVSDNTQYDWNGNALKLGGQPGSSGTWYGVDVSFNAASSDCASADNLTAPNRWRHAPNGGVAVQRDGQLLFAAHADDNVIRVLDKKTGHLDASISVDSPASICTAADDSLWVLSLSQLRPRIRHFKRVRDSWISDTSIVSGFISPLAIGCNRADASVAVLDAATMQVLDFDPEGRLQWTLGKAGGYTLPSPEISEKRFGFVRGFSYIAFLDDGSFWLGDPFNFRNLYFSPRGSALLDEIDYLPANYRVAVDRTDPTRVFAQFLEYSVDYSKPLAKSWKLVRNWASGLGSEYVAPYPGDLKAGIQRPFRLPNGRTYASIFNFSKNAKEIVELDADKGLRPTGSLLPYGMQMYTGGALRHDGRQSEKCGNPCRIYERTLAGFDRQANPNWNPDMVIAQASGIEDIDPVHSNREATYLSEPAYPETDTHRIIFFNAARTKGFHLGAVYRNASAWDWRVNPSGPFRIQPGPGGYLSIVHSGSAFPVDNDGMGLPKPLPALSYAGGTVDADGNFVVFSYPGEGWNGAEASQFLVFLENGAMLGQFGNPGYPALNRIRSVPGFAGNAYGVNLVSFGGKPYLYLNDESGSGGVQRWRFEGVDSIVERSVDVIIAR